MKSKLVLGILLMCLLSLTNQSWVSADGTAPQVNSVAVLDNNNNPTIEIRGLNFGLDPSAVQVLINNTNMTAKIVKIKKKKIIAQLPNSTLCTGTLSVRVVVNRVPSNFGQLDFYLGAPKIENLTPQHAQAGSVVEITGQNLSCQPNNNIVTFNGEPAELTGMTGDKLSVKIPASISTGVASVKLLVSGQPSNTISFNIDTKSSGSNNDVISSGNKLLFSSTVSDGSAGFAPMLSIQNPVVISGSQTNTWDLNFYGTHYAVVKAPWKTIDGSQQLAMVMMDCRYNRNLPGNITNQAERYVYVLVSYPRDPEKAYDPDTNPFFWGSLALCSENFPHGNFIYNSKARSGGGIDSFEISKDSSAKSKFVISTTVIAPDLGYYEDYGINYAKAGKGIVSMPKVLDVKMEFNQVEPDVPVGHYRVGNITLVDKSGSYGSMTTTNVLVHEKLTVDDILFLW